MAQLRLASLLLALAVSGCAGVISRNPLLWSSINDTTSVDPALNSITFARSRTFGLNMYVVSSTFTVPTTNKFGGMVRLGFSSTVPADVITKPASS